MYIDIIRYLLEAYTLPTTWTIIYVLLIMNYLLY